MAWLSNFFAAAKTNTASTSAVDAVTYLASLASDPASIDPVLEDLRELTATAQPGQPLPEKSQMVLAKVYQELEKHLVEHERLRTFTKETIQAKVAEKFPKHNPTEELFWRNINNT